MSSSTFKTKYGETTDENLKTPIGFLHLLEKSIRNECRRYQHLLIYIDEINNKIEHKDPISALKLIDELEELIDIDLFPNGKIEY